MNIAPSKPHVGPPANSPVLVTGATSQIGRFLTPLLSSLGYSVRAVSRRRVNDSASSIPNVEWVKADIGEANGLGEGRGGSLIHIAPLPLAPGIIGPAADLGVKRLVAFGSTSVFSKMDSPLKAEREAAKRLVEAEASVRDKCENLGVDWTIFRPTMIYGCGLDQNVTVIAKFIRRFGFFPLAGEGSGLRQPVHAHDLALACVEALDARASFNRAYNLSGGETITYRDMVGKIFTGLGKKPRLISIPLPLYRFAIRAAAVATPNGSLTVEMADRMNTDLCFDHADATRDFWFSPRCFTYQWM